MTAALQSRLQAVEARLGLVTEFVTEGDERLSSNTEQELYRVAQEALNNVLKHAHASRASVSLSITSDHVLMDIADDRGGFDVAFEGRGGFGVTGMRERVVRLAGSLRIDTPPGDGIRVHVEVPR